MIESLPRIRTAGQIQPPDAPFAVLDIGSNSVRLVAYGGTARNPLPIYNEKSFCRLGAGVAVSGRIEGDYWDDAMHSFSRFRAISKNLKVRYLKAVATAAVREAENASEFVKHAQKILKTEIQILSGEEEANYAAYGALMGFYQVDGLVADLGGGSLELAQVEQGVIEELASLPLGVLVLDKACKQDRAAVYGKIRTALADIKWLNKNKGKPIYLVGGTWRAMASVYMENVNYGLKVLHHFKLSAQMVAPFLKEMAGLTQNQTDVLEAASINRRASIPNAAIMLQELFAATQSDRAFISACGLREGIIYDTLSSSLKAQDPLLSASREMAFRLVKDAEYGEELIAWTENLFKTVKLSANESAYIDRLRQSACILSDIAWSQHLDFRGRLVAETALHAPFTAISHAGRCFIANALFYRHGQTMGAHRPRGFLPMEKQDETLSKSLGLAFRLAHALSGSLSGMLVQTTLQSNKGQLVLTLPKKYQKLCGQQVSNRLQDLSQIFDLKGKIDLED